MENNRAAPHDAKNESDQLEISIEQMLKQLAPISPSCCIYRVPKRIRCLNPNIYTPKVVSIGPLHHDKKELQDMKEHKYRYLNQFLNRTQKNLQFYIQKVRNQEANLRSFYAETIKFSTDEFVTIILLDSAFIIELFLNYYYYYFDSAPRADRMIKAPKMVLDITPDLLLLENQVPFFFLVYLFNRGPIIPDEGEKLSFEKLVLNFFESTLEPIGVDLDKVSSSQVKGKHFIDIVRNLCLPSESLDTGKYNVTTPNITELHRAGVKLRVSSTKNLFSIQFHNGILEIPKLQIYDGVEDMLKNLVAFEQCHYNDQRIAEYFYLLDCFVNNPKDVELLVKYGIVTHALGDSSEVCSLINSLAKEINFNFDDVYFATVHEDLHKHCKRRCNHWKASLRQNYLNSPWAIASVVAASFLILLTIIQTVCSLISL